MWNLGWSWTQLPLTLAPYWPTTVALWHPTQWSYVAESQQTLRMLRWTYTMISNLNLSLATVGFNPSPMWPFVVFRLEPDELSSLPPSRLWKQIHYLYSTYPDRDDDRNHIEITQCTSESFSRCVNIKLLITNWVLIMCPVVLGADKEVSPAVSGLCLVRSEKNHFWQTGQS